MKALSNLPIYSALAIALFGATTIASPSRAQSSTTFVCGTSNGSPATIARTPQGEVPMIIWNSPDMVNSVDSAQKTCEDVATRFQTYYNNGTLKYITTGMMDGQRVACVAETEGGPCSGLLFNLSSADSNSRGTLQRMFRIRIASAAPISETDTRVYISLDKFLSGEYPSFTPNRLRGGDLPQSPTNSPNNSQTNSPTNPQK